MVELIARHVASCTSPSPGGIRHRTHRVKAFTDESASCSVVGMTTTHTETLTDGTVVFFDESGNPYRLVTEDDGTEQIEYGSIFDRPIPFDGTPEQRAANYATHRFASFDPEEPPECWECCSKSYHKAASYPCGQEPPRETIWVPERVEAGR